METPKWRISVIQQDETKLNDIVAAPIQFDQKRMRRKGRDPPLLPVAFESNSGQVIFDDGPIHCHKCYRRIVNFLDKSTFFRPCQCALLYVHTTCALEDDSFFGTQCGTCNKMFQPPQTQSRKGTPERKEAGKEVEDLLITRQMSSSSPSSEICMICDNTRFKNLSTANSEKFEAKFLRPCFCEVSAHHGCMVQYIERKAACDMCGVKYRHFKYGSIMDYFKRYYYQYVCYALFFILIASFFVISLKNSTIFTGIGEFRDLALLILSVFFGLVAIGTLVCMIRYTVTTRLPRFRARYGNVTVVAYNPDAQSKKAARKTLNQARSFAAGEQGLQMRGDSERNGERNNLTLAIIQETSTILSENVEKTSLVLEKEEEGEL